MATPFEYDVALSFAGEDREYVHEVATYLRDRDVRVFYDGFEEAALWGKDLYTYLREIYYEKARFAVVFASRHYAAKVWPSHERESAQARALREAGEYILPARFDDTAIPGVLPTTGYVDLRHKRPAQLAELIIRKLGGAPTAKPEPVRSNKPFRARQPGDRIDRLVAPFRPPTGGINIPPGYQRTLNAHAADIRREFAARDGEGYAFPVQLRGPEAGLQSFAHAAEATIGAHGIEREVSGGVGELWFEYRGTASPARVRELAREHGLEVMHCGATLLLDPNT